MSSNDVQVFARFRPLNDREKKLKQKTKLYHFKDESIKTIQVGEKEYTFDRIFGEETTQAQLYEQTAMPLVSELLNGFNCTMMAYGQTGSGKSFSMMGNLEQDDQAGVIPRMICDIFARLANTEATVDCSYVEIYMEKVRDLLNPEEEDLKLREIMTTKKKATVYIEGCTICRVQSTHDMLKVMKRGNLNRMTAATDMNERSSRSHSVFIISITQTVNQKRRSSKLFLVDLAGSEQIDRSGATGLTLEQAKTINKSLSCLSLVIQSLVEKRRGSHIPYRNSKLTRLLTDSLGGNSKTVLLLAMSPSPDSLQETVSTLGFGSRAKLMENKATVNEELNYKSMVNTITKDLEDWKARNEELLKKNSQLEEQIVLLQKDRAGMTDAEERIKTLEQEKELLQHEIFLMEQQYQNLMRQKDELEHQKNALEEENKALEQQYLVLQNEIKALTDQLKEPTENSITITNTEGFPEETLESIQEEKEEVQEEEEKEKVEEKEADLTRLIEEKAALEARMAAVTEEKQRLVETLKSCQDMNRHMQIKQDRLQLEYNKLKSTYEADCEREIERWKVKVGLAAPDQAVVSSAVIKIGNVIVCEMDDYFVFERF